MSPEIGGVTTAAAGVIGGRVAGAGVVELGLAECEGEERRGGAALGRGEERARHRRRRGEEERDRRRVGGEREREILFAEEEERCILCALWRDERRAHDYRRSNGLRSSCYSTTQKRGG